jgi:hypothetical protein
MWANMNPHNHKGNNTGSVGPPIDLTQAQLTADLNTFTAALLGGARLNIEREDENVQASATAFFAP